MERLNKIVNYINENDIVADVGCDHGYLLKLALENKNIKKGYAIDNKIGPLNCAKTNLSRYNNFDFVLSDGLKQVDANDINCAVIAGMGGTLICDIINDSIDKFKKIKKIILCPNRNIDKVRVFLNDNGFKIIDEDIVFEDDKYYEILVINLGNQKLSEKEIFFGKFLLEKNEKVFQNKWKEYYDKIKNIDKKEYEKKLIEGVLNDC